MKYIKQKILLFVLLLAMAMPVSVYAAGEGNRELQVIFRQIFIFVNYAQKKSTFKRVI